MHTFAELYEKNLKETKKALRESVTKDALIIQCTHAIADLDKVINTLSKRLREWYSLYLPELDHDVRDHAAFAKMLAEKSRQDLLKDMHRTETMGAEIATIDLTPMRVLAQEILALYKTQDMLKEYLEECMQHTCPNMLAVTGGMIGAKLIAQAGSLKRLVMLPASTVQLLGAEKALFRHLTKKSKVPKYGIIINHPLVVQAKKDEKGKAARSLANKISLAAKIDYFRGAEYAGFEMKQKLDEKFLGSEHK